MVSKLKIKTFVLCGLFALCLHGVARPDAPAPASGGDQSGGQVVHEIDPPHTPPAGRRVLTVPRNKVGAKKR